MVCIGNCVWSFRMCKGGSRYSSGGGGRGCALCALSSKVITTSSFLMGISMEAN